MEYSVPESSKKYWLSEYFKKTVMEHMLMLECFLETKK
jgi:hypothetical protein